RRARGPRADLPRLHPRSGRAHARPPGRRPRPGARPSHRARPWRPRVLRGAPGRREPVRARASARRPDAAVAPFFFIATPSRARSMSEEKTRILVVEDEETMIAGLEYALRREGFEVELARDGEAALRSLRAVAPDLVLLDVMLPKRSGF